MYAPIPGHDDSNDTRHTPNREEIHFAQPGWRYVVFREMKGVWIHKFMSGSHIMTSTPNMIYPYEQNNFWDVRMEWQGLLGDFQWALVKQTHSL